MSRSCTPMATLTRFRPTVRCSFSCSSISERIIGSVMVTLRTTPATQCGRTSSTLSSQVMVMPEGRCGYFFMPDSMSKKVRKARDTPSTE